MLLCKQKSNQSTKGKRFLISINVIGSTGPIRFVVDEKELVSAVIETALKSYAWQGRLPVLGSNTADFLLYCPLVRPDALSPWDTIGSIETRNFMLCKKPQAVKDDYNGTSTATLCRRGSRNWKAWINKSFKLKISCQ